MSTEVIDNPFEIDYLEYKSACLSDSDYPGCAWFSVNYRERICLLFRSCDYLISLDEYLPMNDWRSSHECCDYYIEK